MTGQPPVETDGAQADDTRLMQRMFGGSAEAAATRAQDAALNEQMLKDAAGKRKPVQEAVFGNAESAHFDVNCAKHGSRSTAEERRVVEAKQVMSDCIDILKRHKKAGDLYNKQGKVDFDIIKELAQAGYFRLALPVNDRDGNPGRWNGLDVPFTELMEFLYEVNSVSPSYGAVFSACSVIGPVFPLSFKGTAEQQDKFLTGIAEGRFLGSLALTEPDAGGDINRIRTTAVDKGDHYELTGEKLWITMMVPYEEDKDMGGLSAVICNIDGKPSCLLVEIPPSNTDTHEIVNGEDCELYQNDLHAFRELHNARAKFKGLKVPKENLIGQVGDGKLIALSGLIGGRIGLCAASREKVRKALCSAIPAMRKRIVSGVSIGELPRAEKRVGEAIIGAMLCDSLGRFGSMLKDRNQPDELAGMLIKVAVTEMLWRVYPKVMRLSGGRNAFNTRKGDRPEHTDMPVISDTGNFSLGDDLFEVWIKSIYEGPNDILEDKGVPSIMGSEVGGKLILPLVRTISNIFSRSPEDKEAEVAKKKAFSERLGEARDKLKRLRSYFLDRETMAEAEDEEAVQQLPEAQKDYEKALKAIRRLEGEEYRRRAKEGSLSKLQMASIGLKAVGWTLKTCFGPPYHVPFTSSEAWGGKPGTLSRHTIRNLGRKYGALITLSRGKAIDDPFRVGRGGIATRLGDAMSHLLVNFFVSGSDVSPVQDRRVQKLCSRAAHSYFKDRLAGKEESRATKLALQKLGQEFLRAMRDGEETELWKYMTDGIGVPADMLMPYEHLEEKK